MPPPNYAFTISNVNLSTSESDHGKLADLIHKKLQASSSVTSLILAHNDNVPLHAQKSQTTITDFTINSTHIQGLTVTKNGQPCPIFNVYIHPPTKVPPQYESWLSKVKGILYTSIFSPADIAESYHCNMCKGCDHPTGLCPYTEVPSWHTPPTMDPEHQMTVGS